MKTGGHLLGSDPGSGNETTFLIGCKRWTQGCLSAELCLASSERKGLSIEKQPGPLAASLSVTWGGAGGGDGGGKPLATTVFLFPHS